ncbi:toll/interleukin-1 receptor domain-containing protein [Aerosakkonemataceae cyanobacterium BLCC-F50]|uniref:Toll/interleukin-1 receptor domain-containing protein n=1 Tax=Floridaenema flaviceps BLCC-F50 TaxID=3153642 RepID=A0ABV4Y1J5_9CYAN
MGIEVFFSYSHRDEALRDELAKHLSIMRRQGIIDAWYDRAISAGSEWAGEIDAHLNSAQIILLLISADFLASDYCYDIELKRAMERHEAGEACVIPIILKPVDWHGASFGKLQALPKNAQPITTWSDRDEAFLNVAQGIRKVVAAIASGNPTVQPVAQDAVASITSNALPATPSVATNISNMTDRQRRRLEQERDGLLQQFKLLEEKLSQLRDAVAIETDVAHRFKLTKQVEQTEAEMEQLDQKLEALENKLQA